MSYQNKENSIEKNRMGYEPIPGLMFKMSLPLMISMMVQALYNVVDSIFVAMINEDALTAVSLVFPLQMVMISFAVGIGVGTSALLSRYLGAGLHNKVTKVAHNGIIIEIMNAILFIIIGFFAEPFMRMQTNNETIIEYGSTYLKLICWMSIGVMLQVIFERLLQATGKTKYILFAQGSGAIINIILDPILIFGLGSFPKMGIAGAAVATIIGQISGGIIGFSLNKAKNHEVKLSFSQLRPDWNIMKDIYKIGIPSIVMQSVGSVMNFGLNQILVRFSTTAVATFGVYFKLQSFVFMPIFGLNNGIVPIIAFNYGARSKERLVEASKLGVKVAVIAMFIGTVVFWIFPNQLLSMFSASDEMYSIGVAALKILSINFPFAAYSIMNGTVFQALGKSTYSMYTSILRQIGIILPVAYLLSLLGNVDYVWFSFVIAEICGVIMTTFFKRRINRKIIDQM